MNFEPPEPTWDPNTWDPPEPPAPTAVLDPPEPPDPPPPVVSGVVVDMPSALTPHVQTREEELAHRADRIVAAAQALQVVDAKSFAQADEGIASLKAQAKAIEGFFEDDIKRAHAAWDGLTKKRKSYLDPIKAALEILGKRWYAFKTAEERKAAEEQARLEREAQERERERLKKEAEAAAAEAARLEAEAMRADTRDAALELEAQAQETQAQAQQLALDAATAPAPVIHHQSSALAEAGPTKNRGAEKWTFRVTDKMALIKAVAEGKVSHEALLPHDVYLRARAKADKDTIKIPGVQFFDEGSVGAKGRRT
jgi:hypothetical protein